MLDELDRLCRASVRQGVKKLRPTERGPLVRRGIMRLFRGLARRIENGVFEKPTVTTNGSQRPRYAAELASPGVRRVNFVPA